MKIDTCSLNNSASIFLQNEAFSLQSENLAKKKIIQIITLYKSGDKTFTELVSQIKIIKKQSNNKISKDIKNILEELSSFAIIDDLLNDILHELQDSI